MLKKTNTSVVLPIRLTPNAAKNEIGPVEKDAAGSDILKARVTVVPEKGKANKALIKLLSKELRLPAGQISVASGTTNRNKQIEISGDPDELFDLITNWIKDRSK
ncbi:DUF167 family protein [Emcibacter sp.]|uniref:DUF167 family protein n=1 Tax=Emcibacter sp. TaxID=1979954 RepID=UPI002AA76260|nr:DUF167 family protein [Emcibacter sp.]